MKDSRLIALFRAFSEEEFKDFEIFLQSPYFNQSEKLIKLFRLIKPHYPLFTSDKLYKENLHRALHSKKDTPDYSDNTMRELSSDLFKLARTFLSHQALRQNALESTALRFHWFLDHNLENLADPELQARISQLDNYHPHDVAYYHHRRLSDLHQFQLAGIRYLGMEHKLLKQTDLFAPIHSLNREYLVAAFIHYIYLLTMARIYKFTIEPEGVHELTAMSRKYLNKGDTVIDILFNILELNQTLDEKYFYELKKRFLTDDPVVPRDVMTEAAIALENYCAWKGREGNEKFGYEVIEIYRFEVEHGYALVAGKMEYMFYINTAVMGSETDNLDWTDNFVETYKKYLPEEHRSGAYNFAQAYLLFARKNYREALRMALSCQMQSFMFKLQIRSLLARTQYELDMLDELQVELRAQQHHLKDEKLTDNRRKFYETFIKTMKQLSEVKGNYNREKVTTLLQTIDTEKMFANKKWFVEKIGELQESHKGRR